MEEDKFPYRVYDSSGTQVLYAPECCRHDKKIEKSLMESGHTIKLHGKRITKKEVNHA
ncbi:MAG: hypothetical protein ACI4PO_09195 [Faecousia sp.]